MSVQPGAAVRPHIVIAAHLDTVFPEGTNVKVKRDGAILRGPGIGDDCRGLAVLVAVVREMKKARNSRKTIVIISDGGDNNSHYKASEIESLVREADVQIYAMGVFEPSLPLGLTPEEISGPRLLSEIATQTGGRAFSAAAMSPYLK